MLTLSTRTAISELNSTLSEEFEGGYPEQYVEVHVENSLRLKFLTLVNQLEKIQ